MGRSLSPAPDVTPCKRANRREAAAMSVSPPPIPPLARRRDTQDVPRDLPTTPQNPVTAVRRRLGISRTTLAQRSGLGHSVLTRVELGLVKTLPIEVVALLEEAGADA